MLQLFIPPSPPTQETTGLYYRHGFAFQGCHIVGIIKHVALSVTKEHVFKVPLSLPGLIACFFLELNTIPLPGWITVHLFIHLLKNILVAPKFSQLRMKVQPFFCSLYRHKFSTRLGK